MSRHASELGTLLVDDVHGELTSVLFGILLRYGRLSLLALRQHTCLSDKLVRHGLSVLIQHQLVLWYTDKDLTTYEANAEAAYLLVRSGKYVDIVEERVGKHASDLFMNLLGLGHARVGQLVHDYGVKNQRETVETSSVDWTSSEVCPSGVGDGANHDASHVTSKSAQEILHELLELGFVSRVNVSHFRPKTDNRSEAEKVVPPVEHYKAKSKRENEAQWELSVRKKLVAWRYGAEVEIKAANGIEKGRKRQREDNEKVMPQKRQRTAMPASAQTNGVNRATPEPKDEAAVLDDSTILQINHAKFTAMMRNDHLVGLARQNIGTTTASAYAKVLRALEPNTQMSNDDLDTLDELDDLTANPRISTAEIVPLVENTAELANALGNAVNDQIADQKITKPPKKRRKKDSGDEDKSMMNGSASPNEGEYPARPDGAGLIIASDLEMINGDAEYTPNRTSSLTKASHHHSTRHHLLLLARHPLKFLQHFSRTHSLPERWTVDYHSLMKNVTRHALMQIITSRYGILARRITQILFERGKVGEKDLTTIALVPQKTMRSHLTGLHNSGMIQLQEIPRDASRQPARTLFLWFFDTDRCKAKIQEETYKTMARCLQRVRVEEEKVRGTLQKASRSDVVGREEQFLSVQEREALEKWRDLKNRIWGEVLRLDEVLAVMRDF